MRVTGTSFRFWATNPLEGPCQMHQQSKISYAAIDSFFSQNISTPIPDPRPSISISKNPRS